jgi:hypothetical protein
VEIPKKFESVYGVRKEFAHKNNIIKTVRDLPCNYFRKIDEDSLIMEGVSDSPSNPFVFRLLGTCKILNIPCGCYFYKINTSTWAYDEECESYISEDFGDDDHHFKNPVKMKGYHIGDCTACSIAAGFIGAGNLNNK